MHLFAVGESTIAMLQAMFVRFTQLPFSFIVIMMMSALLIGSDAIYGSLSAQMPMVLMVYAILLLAMRTEIPKTQHAPRNLLKSLPIFIGTFVATAIVMIGVASIPFVGELIAASTLEASIEFVVIFGLMHAFVKAYVEEEVFRGRLAYIFSGGTSKKKTHAGDITQAIVFGLFHFFILYITFGMSTMLLIGVVWLMLLGYIWGRMEDYIGTEGTTASHFAYNLAAYGVLPLVFGMLVI